MIVLEVSLDGELSGCFVHPSKGAVGASLHALVVVAIAAPVHSVSYFMASSLALPTAYLVYHYSVFGGYLVAYYLRALFGDDAALDEAIANANPRDEAAAADDGARHLEPVRPI